MTCLPRFFPALLLGTILSFPACADAAPLIQSTLSDDISVPDLPEGGMLSTLSGDVSVGTAEGPLTIHSVSGDIHITTVQGALKVKSLSGDLSLHHASQTAQILSTSGDIQLGRMDQSLTVRTMSGDVRIDHAARDVTLRSVSGDMTLTLEGGSQPQAVDLSTVSGDVTLHLPRGFGGTFDILLKQSRRHVDFPLQQSAGLTVRTGNWERSSTGSDDVRTITATGTVGDGRSHVMIRGIASTVKIIQD